MYANVTAESAGRILATRLWKSTDDKGMKDMLAFLIARDTMHQNQWLAVLEELGGVKGNHPIPNIFPQAEENPDFNYNFISTHIDGESKAKGRWSEGQSIDGKGTFTFEKAKPLGKKPNLGKPHPHGFAQKEQMKANPSMAEDTIDKLK
jgi:Mn-containing catalase